MYMHRNVDFAATGSEAILAQGCRLRRRVGLSTWQGGGGSGERDGRLRRGATRRFGDLVTGVTHMTSSVAVRRGAPDDEARVDMYVVAAMKSSKNNVFDK